MDFYANMVGKLSTHPSRALEYNAPSRQFYPVIFGVMTVGGLAFLPAALIGGSPPWWFPLIFLAICAWLDFGYLYWTYNSVRVEGGVLYWGGTFRRGSESMAEVMDVKEIWSGGINVFELRDGRRIRVIVFQGYYPFLQGLRSAYPHLPLPAGRNAEFVNKFNWRASEDKQFTTPGPGLRIPGMLVFVILLVVLFVVAGLVFPHLQ